MKFQTRSSSEARTKLQARSSGLASCLAGLAILLSGCGNSIWNASDLVQWVQKEAVKAGCDPSSTKLADWYVARNGNNVWPVDCVNARTGQPVKLEIEIDQVWKPSK